MAEPPEPRGDRERTPTLQEAARRRKTLHEALVALEFATSSPAAGRIPDWTRHVVKEVTAVRDAWDQHVEHTEKPGGLYEEIVGISPRLSGNGRPSPRRAPRDHRRRSARCSPGSSRSRSEASRGRSTTRETTSSGSSAGSIRHRQKGADLVWEAYNVDIGGPE